MVIIKEKLKTEKGVRYTKPKKIDMRPLKRLLAWVGVILILIGLFYSIFMKDTQAIRQAASEVAQEVASKPKGFYESTEFSGFAEGFASEYLTLLGETDNYKKRLEPYASGYQLLIDSQMQDKEQIVRSAQFMKYRAVTDNLAEAEVSVGFDQLRKEVVDKEVKKIKTSGRVRVKMLIRNEANGLAIVAPPTIEPEKVGHGTQGRSFTGLLRVSSNNAQPVRETITSYFNVLSTGRPHEVGRYFVDNSDRQGFEGDWIFNEIEAFEAFELEGQARVAVQVKSSWREKVLLYRFMLSHEMIMVKDGTKWYIESVSTRHEEIESKMEGSN